MKKEQIKVFLSPEATAKSFGDHLMTKLDEAESDYHCSLSGGSTPKLLFNYLADHYKEHPKWPFMHFYWGDERCVPPEHADSNFKMTNDLLLTKVAIPRENIHRIKGEEDPDGEAVRYGKEILRNVPKTSEIPVFDMIILGMGDDGHTASIFPHQMELLTEDRLCAVAEHPTSGQQRVTLTGKVLNAAREVVFLVTGAAKKERIAEIYEKQLGWEQFPAAYIDPLNGQLFWFVDDAAVSKLSL
ncbi:MAG: 6-phosphogluconolactonase [Bacteroidota bacterium]